MLELASIWTPDLQQKNYRALLEATSRPGLIQPIHFSQESADALTAVLAALLDSEVSLADVDQQIHQDSWPLFQAKRADVESADYVVCQGHKAPMFEPKVGTLESPEHSATLLLSVNSLNTGPLILELTGPGIESSIKCSISGLNHEWLKQREDWVGAFPLGVDVLLMDQTHVLALPRTTVVEIF